MHPPALDLSPPPAIIALLAPSASNAYTADPIGAPLNVSDLNGARRLARYFIAFAFAPGVELSEPIPQHKKRFAYFRANGGSQDWFMKVSVGRRSGSAWAEPAWMAWAATEQLGPQVHPASGSANFPNLLVSRWLSGNHLDRRTANIGKVRRAVLEQMRRLHEAPLPVHLVPSAPSGPPDYAAGSWHWLSKLEAAGIQHPLATAYLSRVLQQSLHELSHVAIEQTICHRDTHPRNIFYIDGRALFIDWDWAGWDDPFRDPARFFVLAYTPVQELAEGLAIYLGRPALDEEIRRLLLIMLVTEIDFYGADQAGNGPTHRTVSERAEHIQQLIAFLELH